MAIEDSTQQACSAAPSNHPARHLERSHPTGGRVSQIPLTPLSTVCCLPSHLQLSQDLLHANKVVLTFESELSVAEARSWTRSYNLKNTVQLTIINELPQALFVAQFDSTDLISTRARLLNVSPLLGAGEVYASVNNYLLTLDPCNQADYRHLVTVNIPNGSRALYGIIQFLTASIGYLLKELWALTTSICQ